MAWILLSSSASITRGRPTTSAGGLSKGGCRRPRSAACRAKSRGGAFIQNVSRYDGEALQKQIRQLVQTSERSFVRQLHQSASIASNSTRQLKQAVAYPARSSSRTAGEAARGVRD